METVLSSWREAEHVIILGICIVKGNPVRRRRRELNVIGKSHLDHTPAFPALRRPRDDVGATFMESSASVWSKGTHPAWWSL